MTVESGNSWKEQWDPKRTHAFPPFLSPPILIQSLLENAFPPYNKFMLSLLLLLLLLLLIIINNPLRYYLRPHPSNPPSPIIRCDALGLGLSINRHPRHMIHMPRYFFGPIRSISQLSIVNRHSSRMTVLYIPSDVIAHQCRFT